MSLVLQHRSACPPRLDRLEWPASLTIDAYGFRVALRASHRSALNGLQRVIPPGARASDARDADARYSVVLADDGQYLHRLYEGEECVTCTSDENALFASLQSRLHFSVAVGARTRVFLHAGAVGWNGGAILIPGRSYAGKSSLVAALVRAGATYYSDEYAVLDVGGLVHPFARSLGIREGDGTIRQLAPSSLGARIGVEPLPVRTVVLSQYVPGAVWSPLSMTPGERVLALFEHTVAARSRPVEALRLLCTATVDALGIRSARGEAEAVADQILSAC
ncbi:MAG: hypothetical protein JF601_08140 [Acidobacteria bacterium]|nr:hypothetical protein [Acidobacteriota bacterium]